MRGFTLIEVLVALTVLGLTFGALLSLLSDALLSAQRAERDWEDLLFLSRAIDTGRLEGVEVEEFKLKGVGLRVRVYRRGGVELMEVQ
ncbi:MAG: type II secretion system protein [Aquificae bacterium]|nr:type II secretion system protein [Aquificota bacterium]